MILSFSRFLCLLLYVCSINLIDFFVCVSYFIFMLFVCLDRFFIYRFIVFLNALIVIIYAKLTSHNFVSKHIVESFFFSSLSSFFTISYLYLYFHLNWLVIELCVCGGCERERQRARDNIQYGDIKCEAENMDSVRSGLFRFVPFINLSIC